MDTYVASAAGNTSDASNKNNCPCSSNQHVNCDPLQDGGGNKGLGMTLFTSADCFKNRREAKTRGKALPTDRNGEDGRETERERERGGGRKDRAQRRSDCRQSG
jgi:hypothetical protein